MFCTNCGANVPTNSNFCGLCGAKITMPVAARSADTSNTDAPAPTKPETVQFADTGNTDAPARTKPETVPFADASNIEAPARTKPETVPFADASNIEAPARTKPETVQFPDTSNIEAPGRPKPPQTAPVKKEMEFEGAVRKLFGLGVFCVITAGVGSILPVSWIGSIEYIILAIVLAGFGSIALSLVFGGNGFDYLGRGFVLALFGLVLVKIVFGWDLESPYEAVMRYVHERPLGTNVELANANAIEPALAVFLTMAMNFGKVAVGMVIVAVIVAILTLPIIFLLNSKR